MFATAHSRLVQAAGWGLMVLTSAIVPNVAGAQSLEPSPSSSASAKPWENPDTTSAKAMKRVADKAAKSAEPAKPAKATAKSSDAAKAVDAKKATPTPAPIAGAPATPASPPSKDSAKPATAATAAPTPAKPAAATTAAPAVVAPVVAPAPPVVATPQAPTTATVVQPSTAAAPSAAPSPTTAAATSSTATATTSTLANPAPAAVPAQWNPIETGSIATPSTAVPTSDTMQYADWILECFGAASKKCGLRQTVTDSRGRRIVQLTARHSGKTPYLEVIVPVGISIPFGVELQLADDTKVVPKLADCDAKGCRAVTALDDNVLASIKSAKGLAVVFQDAKSGKVLKVTGSLAGFSDGVGKVIAGL